VPELELPVTQWQGELVILRGACGTWRVHEGVCSVQECGFEPADVVLEQGTGHSAHEVIHAGLEG
jgi:hypothetical protein